MKPIRFERTAAGKAKGCLVYVVAAPVVAFTIWLIAAGTIHSIFTKWFHASSNTAYWVAFAFLPIILLATIKWSWKDYFRAGNAHVSVSDERIEVATSRGRRSFPLQEIRDVRLKPYYDDLKVVLLPEKGLPAVLPADLVPFKTIRDSLESTLIPLLEARLGEKVAAGDTVWMTESRWLAALRFPWGVLNLVFGILLVCSIADAHWGVDLLAAAPRSFRRGRRGLGGGFEIRAAGIAASSGIVKRTIAWEDLQVLKFDQDGLVLSTRRGTLSVSPYATHYWPASRWIVSRLSQR